MTTLPLCAGPLQSDGSLDNLFASPSWSGSSGQLSLCDGGSNGGSAVGNTGVGTHDEFAVARYNQDGSPDLSFGTGGKVIGTGTNTGHAVAFVTDGKFIVAGTGPVPGNTFTFGVLLARYDTEGKLDLSFGTNGLAATPADVDEQLAVNIQSSLTVGDKILVATGSNLVRFLINGAPDTTFGPGGLSGRTENSGIAFQNLAGSPTRIFVTGTA